MTRSILAVTTALFLFFVLSRPVRIGTEISPYSVSETARWVWSILAAIFIFWYANKKNFLENVKKVFPVLFVFGLIFPPLFSSYSALRHHDSPEACHAWGRGDCDGYTNYASFLTGHNYFFNESQTFRGLPTYHPYLTRIALAISPKSDFFITAGGDDYLKKWSMKGDLLSAVPAQQLSITSLAISSDGSRIFSGGWDSTIKTWNSNLQKISSFNTGQLAITSLALSSDNTLIASGGWDGSIGVWKPSGQQRGKFIRRHEGTVMSVAFGKADRTVLSTSSDWTARETSIDNSHSETIFQDYFKIYDLSYLAANDSLILSSNPINKCTRTANDRWTCRKFETPSNNGGSTFMAVARSKSDSYFASGSHKGLLFLTDNSTHLETKIEGHHSLVTAVKFSNDEKFLISASRDGTVAVWNTDGKAVSGMIRAHSGYHPAVGPTGLIEYIRQPGYPLFIATYMSLLKIYNSCSAIIVQSLFLCGFLVFGFLFAKKNYGGSVAYFGLLPFYDHLNHFALFTQTDFTEAILIFAFPLIALTLFLAIQNPNRGKYLGACLSIILIASQIKMLTCFYVFFLITGVLLALLIYKQPITKGTIKILGILGTSSMLLALITTSLFPEATLFNRTNTTRRFTMLRAQPSQDPLLEKFRRFQDYVNDRYRRIYNKPLNDNQVAESIIWELTSAVAQDHDDHAFVDNRTGEVFYFKQREIFEICKKLFFQNPVAYIKSGLREMKTKFYLWWLETGHPEALPLGDIVINVFSRQGIRDRLILFFTVIGLSWGLAKRQWPFLALFTSMILMYGFIAFVHIVVDRYWIMFTAFYYLSFGFGVSAVMNFAKKKVLQNESRVYKS